MSGQFLGSDEFRKVARSCIAMAANVDIGYDRVGSHDHDWLMHCLYGGFSQSMHHDLVRWPLWNLVKSACSKRGYGHMRRVNKWTSELVFTCESPLIQGLSGRESTIELLRVLEWLLLNPVEVTP